MELNQIQFGFTRRLPIVLQTEAAECGLACLAMVAGFHGFRIDLSALRRHFTTSLKGMTLQDLASLSGKLSLATRALRIELEELPELRLPAILHWDFNHYVVLERISAHGVLIHDPASGKRTVSHSELNKHFTGIALEAFPTPTFQKQTELKQFKLSSLFDKVSGLKRALGTTLLLAACLEVLALLGPIGLQIIIDQAVVSNDIELVTTIGMGLFIVLILQVLITFGRSWMMMVLSTRLSLQWEVRLFSHLIRLPLAFFESRHVGDILSRFRSLDPVQRTLTTDLIEAIIDGGMLAGLLGMMFLYNSDLTVLALVVISIYILIRILFYRPYRESSEERLVHQSRESSHFMETIRGAASLKALGLETNRLTSWFQRLADATNSGLKIRRIDILFDFIEIFLFGFGRIIMLWLGARAIIHGQMTVGMFMAYSFYQEQFFSRSNKLTDMAFRLRMLGLHAQRLADIALTNVEEDSGPNALRPRPKLRTNATLEVKDIHFRYGTGEAEILKGINLTVEPGASIAIVGPSGCGKTTLLKILAGLISPSSGEVQYGGESIKSIGLSNYRALTGCVLQDDRMFSGTIAENIACFDPVADQAWIEECARIAHIHTEIAAMPMGYSSFVGDMGSLLSGGQKQRLYLARALYRKPTILFLDESTSHLDEDNESLINEAISSLGITRIIVAHRPKTITLADKSFDLTKQVS
ncbi:MULTISPECIES: peptidase domain-containing ABC transporter [unclassified Brenneria]|uniref:peptidase domain-containing ABC transporter n=1 Tax=unclassified Brenneria TaxID=2634434 RepID=UPI0029C2B888|nr:MULTISPECIES: peptidase domain-containing ABC transporter [unclassified Brenneria]MDX5627108.1 peptidase domain-containing ABC transporter [Brenneria sp. L3-3Z]MDX5693542.1 peptidase domain-containing ABC transporter [Brenneria sp. L4-2C]